VVSGQDGQDGLFASAVWDKDRNAYIVKAVNTGDEAQPLHITFAGLKKSVQLSDAEVISLHSDNLEADNTLCHPDNVVPQTGSAKVEGNVLDTTLPARTFAVYIVTKK
jgi:alpha-L-arabinofuranosidase